MDFHSLARKELQAICKLNQIPANMTNIAMADALKSLDIVEGIEDFLKPSESVTAESSIDSPERNVVNSPKIPLTGRRTSTRRKPVGEESESVQIMTKSTRRMTRRAISGEITEEAKANIPKTPAVRSSRKTVPAATVSRMEIQSKESEEHETPAVVPNSRRKAAAVSTRQTNLKKEEEVGTVQRVYSTRRSARLTDKKLVESIPMGKDMNKAITIDLIASEISENDLGEVSDNMNVSDAGNDSQTVLQELVNKSDSVDSQTVLQESVNKSDSVDSQTVLQESHKSDSVYSEIVSDVKDDDVQEEKGDNEVDEPKAISEEISEAFNESDVVKSDSVDSQTVLQELVNKSDSVDSEIVSDVKDDDVQEDTGDNEVDEPKAISEEISEALNESAVVKSESAGDMKDFDVQEESGDNHEVSNEILDLTEVLVDENMEEKAFDMQNKVLTNKESLNVDMDLDSEEKAATDMKTDVIENEVELFPMDSENPREQLKLETREEFNSKFLNCNDPKENDDQPETNSIDSSVELDSEKSVAKELGLELATDLSVQEDLITAMDANDSNETKPTFEQLSMSPASVKGNVFASFLADDSLTNQFPSSVVGLGHIASPIHSTPVKKSSTKTPTIKKFNHVSDDKENIDHSGRKCELTKEKAKKTNKKDNALNDKQKAALNEKSLRELTKLLKEKLQISNNPSEDAKDKKLIYKVTKARPALQNLSENCLVASNIEN